MDNFDPTKRAEGLGDLVAKITHQLGIARAVHTITKAIGVEDCGCEGRREALNELIPFNKNKEKNKNDAGEGIENEPPL